MSDPKKQRKEGGDRGANERGPWSPPPGASFVSSSISTLLPLLLRIRHLLSPPDPSVSGKRHGRVEASRARGNSGPEEHFSGPAGISSCWLAVTAAGTSPTGPKK